MDIEKTAKMGLSSDGFKYSLGFSYLGEFLTLKNISEAKQDFQDAYSRNKYSSLVSYYEAISVDLTPTFSEDFFNGDTPGYLVVEEQPQPKKVFLPDVEGICYSFTLPRSKGRLGVINSKNAITIKFHNKISDSNRVEKFPVIPYRRY